MSLQRENIVFRFAEFELGGPSLELRRGGVLVALQPQPARALILLLSRAGETVTRKELRVHLWGADHHLNHEQGINFTIRKIRESLDDSSQAPRFLETVPRQGYRFLAPVEQRPVDPPLPGASRGSWIRKRMGMVTVSVLGALAVLAGGLRFETPALEAPAPARLAVMPFSNAGIAPLDDAVPRMVTEELVTHFISRYGPRLGVVAMGPGADRIEGRPLADFLLCGNVSRSDAGLRITVRLWRVDDRVHLWAHAFEMDVAHLPAWYELVAVNVTDALGMGSSVPVDSAARPPIEP